MNKISKVNQKTHKERQQLTNRRHLGFLEKKKDYKSRANYYNQKKNLIKKCKKLAHNKNENEFYFHMIKNDKKNNDQSEKIKLKKSRDLKYINMKLTMEKKKIDKLKSNLHFIDEINEIKRSHIYFVDSEKDAISFDHEKHLDTSKIGNPLLEETSTIRNLKNKKYTELYKRFNREKELRSLQQGDIKINKKKKVLERKK
ncbi:hypothetical protein PGB90_000155 [Kerria lacca]